MQAFLIDPFEKKISTVEYDGSLKYMYGLLGCDCVDRVEFNDVGDTAWIDDEGLLKTGNNSQRYFILQHENGGTSLLAGMCLILGHDGFGESIAPVIQLDLLRQCVHFVPDGLLDVAETIAEQLVAGTCVQQLLTT